MGDIVDWNSAKNNRIKQNAQSSNKAKEENRNPDGSCTSPIEIYRIDEFSVVIRFCNLFRKKKLLRAIAASKALLLGRWSISGGPSQFLIRLEVASYSELANTVRLGNLADYISMQAYIHEIQVYNLRQLTIQGRLQYNMPDKKTIQIFKASGMNMYQLMTRYREDICCVRGMTTRALFQLEKYLATCGVFIRSRGAKIAVDPCSYDGNKRLQEWRAPRDTDAPTDSQEGFVNFMRGIEDRKEMARDPASGLSHDKIELEDMGLTLNTTLHLAKHGVKTLADLERLTEGYIMKISGYNLKVLLDVKRNMKRYGTRLAKGGHEPS